jgi:hypothetical protein
MYLPAGSGGWDRMSTYKLASYDVEVELPFGSYQPFEEGGVVPDLHKGDTSRVGQKAVYSSQRCYWFSFWSWWCKSYWFT